MELAPDERAVAERAVRAGLVPPDALRHGLALRAQLAARGRRVPVEAVVEALAPPATGRLPVPDVRLLRQLLAAGPAWAQVADPLLRAEAAPTLDGQDAAPTLGAPPRAAAPPPPRADEVLAAAARASAAAFQVDPRFAPLATLALEPLGELGRGGMGVVLRVRDRRLDRLAALKLLHDAGDERAVQRFIREAEVTARLDHPAIPPVYEAGLDAQGRHYLLMRLVGGEPLKKRIERWHAAGHPPGEVSRELVEALVRVAEAVAYAHGKAVIHRDLKPANVMVGEFGEVLVMDWGLAALDAAERAALAGAARTVAAAEGEPLTLQGAVLGTPGYMPPEQAAGEELDARADVFALGAILCELLAGRPPISGDTSLEKILRTVQGKVARPSALRPGVPAELDDLAARALDPDPARRLPSAADLVRELRAWLAGDDLASHRYGPGERALRALRRRPARAVALAAGALLLLVAGGALAQVREAARRATDEARATAIEGARAASEEARARFEAGAGDRTGLGLAAVQAAQRWHDLARTPESAEARLAAAGALAAVASASQQWSLAVEAHRLGLGLGRDEAVEAAVAAVESARTARTRAHRAQVAVWVAGARASQLVGRDALEDAVVLASRWDEPEVVADLIAELDRLAGQLREVRREALLRLAVPTEEEARSGERRIEGLAEALRALDEGPRPRDPEGPLRLVLERLARREARVAGRDDGRGVGSARVLVAAQQLREASHEQLTRLLCELLGRLRADAAVAALARFLRAEEDAGRSALALVALCRIDTPASVAEALRARQGWDPRSDLGLRTLAILQLGAATPAFAPDDPDGPRLRAELRSLRAAPGEDGASDYDRAVAARPEDAATLRGRAQARRRMGDAAGARADAARATDLAPDAPDGWALLGELEGQLGDEAGSERAFERALALAPDRASVWQARALTRDQRGALSPAAEDHARAVRLDPTLALSWERLVVLRLALGRLAEALRAADEAVVAVPGHGPVWRARAEARLNAGEVAGARSDADEAVRRSPGDPGAWAVRAIARVRLGEHGAAGVDAERAVALDLNDPRAWWSLCEALSAIGDLAAAVTAAERLVRVDARDPGAWQLLARTRLRRNDARGSLVAAEQAVTLGPRDPASLVARARARQRTGDLAGAEADCDQALALDPRRAAAWLARGEARAAAGRPGADDDVDRAVTLQPDDVEARRTRAALRAGRDDLAGALQELDHAARVAPGDLEVARDRGRLRQARGDHAGAVEELSRVLAARSGDPDARTYRGLARLALGELDGAREDLDRALLEAPTSRLARAARCGLRQRRGDLAGSLEDADLLVVNAPDDPALRLLRARLQAQRGAAAAAIADLEHLLRVAPGSAEAAGARALLEELRR